MFSPCKSFNLPKRQSGITLILTALFIFVATITVLFSILDADDVRNERNKTTTDVLAKAKEVLISRAVMDDNRPGSLPCPDSSDDGTAELFAGNSCPVPIGRFPWKTLDISDLRDGYTERLWYVLSPSFRDHTVVQPLNSSTAGTMSVDGRSDLAAIIFAPGPPINQQSRPSNSAVDYLEGTNSDGDNAYSAITSAALNDQLIVVTRDELMQAVTKRAAGELKSKLKTYKAANGRFPDASPMNAPLGNNNYVAVSGSDSGTVPVDVTDTVTCDYSSLFPNSAECEVAFSLVEKVSLQRTDGYRRWDSATGLCTITTTNSSFADDTCTCTGAGRCYTGTSSLPTSEFECNSTGVCNMNLLPGTNGVYIYAPPSYGTFPSAAMTPPNCSASGTANVQCSGDGSFGIQGINMPSWFKDNNWQDFFYYRKRTASDLQVGAATGVEVVILGTGSVLNDPTSKPGAIQVRPSSNINDYLDSLENANGDLIFDSIRATRSSTFNDQSFIVAP